MKDICGELFSVKHTLFPRIHVHATVYETGAEVHAPKVSPNIPVSGIIESYRVS